jgi:Fic family protein
MADWDADSPRLTDNLFALLRRLSRQATDRQPPTLDEARSWHAELMAGLEVPNPAYVGRFRGEPSLETVGVRIGRRFGSPPDDVVDELERFITHLRDVIAYLDELIPIGNVPDGDTFDAVIDVCGWAHAEWVRIHPFANGNGRTARLWANVIAMRYGLPPFVRLRPRPEADTYAGAGARAMDGEWQPTVEVFRKMLEQFLQEYSIL